MRRLGTIAILVSILGLFPQAAGAQWWVDNRAATPAESYARGVSDVVRSQGDYNLNTSEAMLNLSEVRRREIENARQWTDTYFEMRAANRAYRAEERQPRATSEQMVRWAKEDAPDRLSPSELDPVSGKVSWPVALKTDDFEKMRAEIESLYNKRAAGGVLTIDERRKLRDACNLMQTHLKDQIRDLPPSDYLAAKKFIDSLSYEASLPTS